jgi:hypothetical protein
MSQLTGQTQNAKPDDRPQPGPTVAIKVNGLDHNIHRGHQTVTAIKQVGGVPLADDLEQIVDGSLVLLTDDGAVTIKGGEQFVSHPKDSGSSSH